MSNNTIHRAAIRMLVQVILAATMLLSFSAWCHGQSNQRRTTDKIMRQRLSRVGINTSQECSFQKTDNALEVHIHWKAYTSPRAYVRPDTEQPTPGGGFSVMRERILPGPLPPPRSAELSPDQLIVAAVDAQQHLCDWNIVLYSRILRAEEPSAKAQKDLTGRVLHITDSDFIVTFPENSAITELRFYKPRWNKTVFDLDSVGMVSLQGGR